MAKKRCERQNRSSTEGREPDNSWLKLLCILLMGKRPSQCRAGLDGQAYWNSGLGLPPCPATAVKQQPRASQSGMEFHQRMLIRTAAPRLPSTLPSDSQSWIPDDKDWMQNVKQMVTFPKINLFTNKKTKTKQNPLSVCHLG